MNIGSIFLTYTGTAVIAMLIVLISTAFPLLVAVIALWITRVNKHRVIHNQSKGEAVDKRLQQDVEKLSTDHLVLCWSLLSRQMEECRRSGSLLMADEFSARLRAIEDEIGARQARLFEVS